MNRLVNPLQPKGGAGVVVLSQRLKTWAREILALGEDDVVSVTELACSRPGCAPRETVILLLPAGGGIHQMSIHRAMADVTREDVIEACVMEVGAIKES
jgi:hypothetical protein